MASSLDRLKELTTKLEEKLIEKGVDIKEQTHPNPSLSSTQSSLEVVNIEEKDELAVPSFIRSSLIEEPKEVEPPLIKEKPITKSTRRENIDRIKVLYLDLNIVEKSPDFENIFIYKAMNLSGIGLKEEDFGEVRAGKYIQVIAITYEPDANGKKKAKNISLGYFGKGDTIDLGLKHKIIEFVLRWRYEKAFQNVQHYKELIAKLDVLK